MIADLQIMSSGAEDLGLVFWMPKEYWQAILATDSGLSGSETQEVLAALRPFTIIAAVDGRLGPLGGAHFVDGKTLTESISILDKDGKAFQPLSAHVITPDVRNLIDAMKPMFANMLGPMGENVHFVIFSAMDADGEPLADVKEKGYFRVLMDGELYEWRLPLPAFVPEKICPVDGDRLSGGWSYCPWHGVEPQDAAIGGEVIEGLAQTSLARGLLDLAALQFRSGEFTSAVDSVLKAGAADVGTKALSGNFLYTTLNAFSKGIETDVDRETLTDRLGRARRNSSASAADRLGLFLALREAGETDRALEIARALSDSSEISEPVADAVRIMACELRSPSAEEAGIVVPEAAASAGSIETPGGVRPLDEEISGEVAAPVKLFTPQPTYPESAKMAGVEGRVIVQAIIDKEGCVTRAEILKGLAAEPNRSAWETVRHWVFRPATLNGEPVDVYYNLTVHFRLNSAAGG